MNDVFNVYLVGQKCHVFWQKMDKSESTISFPPLPPSVPSSRWAQYDPGYSVAASSVRAHIRLAREYVEHDLHYQPHMPLRSADDWMKCIK
eukprot:scaffold108217_cov31-Prasinocladus_malaysianus.AAC.2